MRLSELVTLYLMAAEVYHDCSKREGKFDQCLSLQILMTEHIREVQWRHL